MQRQPSSWSEHLVNVMQAAQLALAALAVYAYCRPAIDPVLRDLWRRRPRVRLHRRLSPGLERQVRSLLNG